MRIDTTSDRRQTLETVRQLRRLIDSSVTGIGWTTQEMRSSTAARSSHRRGFGDEVRGYKVWQPGDSLKHIHVAATLASTDANEIIIRTHYGPKVVRLNVLLDVGPAMIHGTCGLLKAWLGSRMRRLRHQVRGDHAGHPILHCLRRAPVDRES